jgi:hypothetical protein
MNATLRDIAHSRAGDKGNLNSLSLIAYQQEAYPWLAATVTTSLVAEHLRFRVVEVVARFECPLVRTLLFVVRKAAQDTVNTSLWLDTHGKSLSSALLDMPIEVPDQLVTGATPITAHRVRTEQSEAPA